jgi:nucleoside-diphosphate-sugar epimerase
MKILIAGVNGFIGSHITKALIDNKHEVTALTKPDSDFSRLGSVKIKKIVIHQYNDLILQLSKTHYDCIIQVAGILKPEPSSTSELLSMIDANFQLPSMLLYAASILGIPNYIHTSTVLEDAYVNDQYKNPTPINYYAATKKAIQPLLLHFAKVRGINIVDLRLHTIYGENDNQNKLIPALINSHLTKTTIKIKNPHQIINPVYISDVTAAYMCALQLISSIEKSAGILKRYDISGKFPLYIYELIKQIELQTKTSNIVILDNRNEINNLYKKIVNPPDFPWKQKVTLSAGLNRVISYQKNLLNKLTK